jgi:hypothetical protein
MSSKDLFEMSEAEHMEWLREQGAAVLDLSKPSEENLCRLVGNALRAVEKEDRAQSFVDIANMALAMADITLGSEKVVPQCLVMQRH